MDLGENQAMETTTDKIRYSIKIQFILNHSRLFKRREDILAVHFEYLLFQMNKLLDGQVLRYSLQGTVNQTWEVLLRIVWLIG